MVCSVSKNLFNGTPQFALYEVVRFCADRQVRERQAEIENDIREIEKHDEIIEKTRCTVCVLQQMAHTKTN